MAGDQSKDRFHALPLTENIRSKTKIIQREGKIDAPFLPQPFASVAGLVTIGFQLVLSFLNYDIASSPREPLHPLLMRGRQAGATAGAAGKAAASDEATEQLRRQA